MVHGEQWSAVFEDVPGATAPLLPEILERGTYVGEGEVELEGGDGVVRMETGFALAYPETPLRYLALCATNSAGPEPTREFVTAFPWCAEGVEADLEIEEVLADRDDPMEGGLEVAAPGGGLMWLVDPFFFQHRHLYAPERTVRLSIAALAYSVSLAARDFVEVTEGPMLDLERSRISEADPDADPAEVTSVRLSLEGARALFPHPEEPLFGSTFRAPVEDLDEFSVGGVRFTRMLIAPLTTDAGAVGMWLYASERVLQGCAPRVGDEIEGFAWLQATLVSSTSGE
ncbi:MAG TPA: hypothetical protein VFL93_03040 [Longimicrobiaceae bacterium]|jgi:hypothetical protein|nr:hypothetical protein [Longimicrobiaceae bacterium]